MLWYKAVRKAQAIGGGIVQQTVAPSSAATDTNDKHVWDTLVNSSDHIGNHKGEPAMTPDGDAGINEGPATKAVEMRRITPHHKNPEFTTLEEQLTGTRQQNVNQGDIDVDTSEQQPGTTDPRLIRGIPQFDSGKGGKGLNDNVNVPSAQTFAQ